MEVFRADLEQHRQFRAEQLDELTADMSTGSHSALDEVASALMTAAVTALADIDVDVWGYGSFPASDPPANW
ncbi:hypothetical protein [Kribbella catacumbae]|uniref:hypothetical protein n=1 Tax=Kribbella catacumbae TaxID=460086 RepID=UPI0003672BF2|nr:hypothetical protein [Kribbella catacumbae]